MTADEMGRVAGRLAAPVSEAVSPPVRTVKFLGDAAMLLSPDPAAMLRMVVRLVEAVDAESEVLPEIHVGAAYGPAVPRAGDWFGQVVNLASRIVAVARPGTILGDQALRRVTSDRFVWTRVPQRHLRGVSGLVQLHRLRGPREADADRRSKL